MSIYTYPLNVVPCNIHNLKEYISNQFTSENDKEIEKNITSLLDEPSWDQFLGAEAILPENQGCPLCILIDKFLLLFSGCQPFACKTPPEREMVSIYHQSMLRKLSNMLIKGQCLMFLIVSCLSADLGLTKTLQHASNWHKRRHTGYIKLLIVSSFAESMASAESKPF